MKIYKSKISQFSEKEYNDAFSMMDDQRKASVLRKKIENDRKRSVLGEKLAREGISKLCGISPEKINFCRTENGKPFAKNVDIHFSISHCKELVVCAVSENEVGIDAEFIRDIDLKITKIACTESDKAFIFASNDPNEQKLRFFYIWTAKEAYIKFHGTSISDLKKINYLDIEPFCKSEIDDGFMITIYQGGNL